MVSTKNLKILDYETEIYTSLHGYGDAIRYIFKENNITADITWISKRFENKEDEETRKYWAERFNNIDPKAYINPYSMLRIRTYFDPDELFDFLINAVATDSDIQKYLSAFKSGPHVPDPNILE